MGNCPHIRTKTEKNPSRILEEGFLQYCMIPNDVSSRFNSLCCLSIKIGLTNFPFQYLTCIYNIESCLRYDMILSNILCILWRVNYWIELNIAYSLHFVRNLYRIYSGSLRHMFSGHVIMLGTYSIIVNSTCLLKCKLSSRDHISAHLALANMC